METKRSMEELLKTLRANISQKLSTEMQEDVLELGEPVKKGRINKQLPINYINNSKLKNDSDDYAIKNSTIIESVIKEILINSEEIKSLINELLKKSILQQNLEPMIKKIVEENIIKILRT